MTTDALVLVGAGGFGREVAAFIRARSMQVQVAGFIDDEKTGAAILGTIEGHVVEPGSMRSYITCFGDGRARTKVRLALEQRGARFTTLVFPDAMHASVLGDCVNSIFMGACTISCDVTVGNDVLVQGMAVIGHDVSIGHGVTVSAHAFVGGWAHLGDYCTLHPHAVVLPHVKVGEGAVVGAGTVVIKDVAPYTTVFGSPAKVIYRDERRG